MNRVKIFLLFLIVSLKFYGQNDCKDFVTVCGNNNLSDLTAQGAGLIKDFKDITRCKIPEVSSLWLKVNIQKGGTLGFTLTPESSDLGIDFDFYVFGPNVSCDNLGDPIRYTFTNPQLAKQSTNITGMSSIASESFEGLGVQQDCKDIGTNGDGFVQWLTTQDNESYFIVICRYSGDSKFSVTWNGSAKLYEPPTFKTPDPGFILNSEKCDTDSVDDNATLFDLTQKIDAVVQNQPDITITYHTNANDAILGENPIMHPEAFRNTSLKQKIYIRLTNSITKCFTTADFSISLNNYKLQFPTTTFDVCDDSSDGNDNNGKSKFYLKDITETFFPNKKDLNIKYYLTQADAENNLNELTEFFYNTIPAQQFIYAKASDSFYCPTIRKITLNVNPLPAKTSATLRQCDSSKNGSGLVLFNLDQANSELTLENPNMVTHFFLNKNDAENNTNAIAPDFYNTTNPQTLYASITNSITKCSTVGTLTLKTNPVSIIEHTLNPVCDDDGIEDGLHLFDLSDTGIVTSNLQTVKYYSSEKDALLEKDAIENIKAYQNRIPYNQDVYARVEENNNCLEIHKINLEVNKLPSIETAGFTNVCEGSSSYYAHLESGITENSIASNFSYEWTKDGIQIPNQILPTLDVNETGIYTVTVKNKFNCSKTRTIEVTTSNKATITKIDITDLTINDSNKITVIVTGKGEYEYALDNPNGPFQDSNTFENVPAGIYEVYINDKKNCGTIHKTVAVIGAPKFFTPNNDGHNDYWNIEGLNTDVYKKAVIFIYDRYGKLIKQIHPSDLGWDGTFTGNPLPSDDYWYTLKLEDNREAKGHFSLKR
ncbi:T9SS type B sorting domain-containing protein [Flavobacterium sp. GN10]|uniref:T9SS type B sorting domain-containing protein n=1 Tax=Flavobacterium tagetis TaxID=2801336 RepID=A0ABS1KIQ3_9FLAO|nr:T9SS type B sorting domain-containing protein [Flavobacterium tagetis]MBL0739250.1 T9SS type B sorting domain-containing protein [Flavobacterium tagetis]